MKRKRKVLNRVIALLLLAFLVIGCAFKASAADASFDPKTETYSFATDAIESPAPGVLTDYGVLTVKNTGKSGCYVGPVTVFTKDGAADPVYENADLSAMDLSTGEDLFYSPAKDLAFRLFVPAGETKQIGLQYQVDKEHAGSLPALAFTFVAESDTEGGQMAELSFTPGPFNHPKAKEKPIVTSPKTKVSTPKQVKEAKDVPMPKNHGLGILFVVLLGGSITVLLIDWKKRRK